MRRARVGAALILNILFLQTSLLAQSVACPSGTAHAAAVAEDDSHTGHLAEANASSDAMTDANPAEDGARQQPGHCGMAASCTVFASIETATGPRPAESASPHDLSAAQDAPLSASAAPETPPPRA